MSIIDSAFEYMLGKAVVVFVAIVCVLCLAGGGWRGGALLARAVGWEDHQAGTAEF